MKELLIFAGIILLSFACIRKDQVKPSYLDTNLLVEQRVDDLLGRMTLEEKVGQLDQFVGINSIAKQEGDGDLGDIEDVQDLSAMYKDMTLADLIRKIKNGEIGSFLHVKGPKEANYLQAQADSSRLRIPLLITIDAIHGHGLLAGGATIFPTQIGLASSFDTTLLKNVGKITAREMRATGFHLSFSPNVEVVRDARWGRTGETFGEDPLLVGSLGAAMIKGYQGDKLNSLTSVASCTKHFIAGGETLNGLNATPVDMSERKIREIYLPPFENALQAGTKMIMMAHHELNGIPCHADKYLINDMLQAEMGFDGPIISDWKDIELIHEFHKVAKNFDEAYQLGLEAGVDIHMHGPGFFESVIQAVNNGTIEEKIIHEAARRVLKLKFELGLFENRYVDLDQVNKHLLLSSHKEKALEAAEKSIVLLKNEDNLLPLSKNIKSVFITGPNANNISILGDWVFDQPEENVITVLEGVKKVLPESCEIEFYDCGDIREITDDQVKEAVQRAKGHGHAILAVGTNADRTRWTERTSGENVGISSLELQGKQGELIKALHDEGLKVVLVLINAHPLSPTWPIENIPGIIEAWEPGMMGGEAIARVIFGDYNPSGRLPISIPRNVGQVQQYYNHKPSFTGRGVYAFSEKGPVYPFGFGLSYTSFEYKMKIPKEKSKDDPLEVAVNVKNTGDIKGEDIVLVYMNDIYSSVTTPVKQLIAFSRVELEKGEEKQIIFTILPESFSLLNRDFERVVEPGDFEIMVGNQVDTLRIY